MKPLLFHIRLFESLPFSFLLSLSLKRRGLPQQDFQESQEAAPSSLFRDRAAASLSAFSGKRQGTLKNLISADISSHVSFFEFYLFSFAASLRPELLANGDNPTVLAVQPEQHIPASGFGPLPQGFLRHPAAGPRVCREKHRYPRSGFPFVIKQAFAQCCLDFLECEGSGSVSGCCSP